jgi:hypothetical protein
MGIEPSQQRLKIILPQLSKCCGKKKEKSEKDERKKTK